MSHLDKQIYTVNDVAGMTGFSRNTVVRLFENEHGVIVLERSGSLRKRRYRSIRIPRFVFERVLKTLSVA